MVIQSFLQNREEAYLVLILVILVLILVRVIQSILLRSSRLLLGKGRGGGHGHTEPSVQKLSSTAGRGKDTLDVPIVS